MAATGFDSETILKAIHTKWAGNTVHFADETDSTNRFARELAKAGAPHGTLAAAEFQTAGRGRFERSWNAPKGSAVMMSLVLRPDFAPRYAPMLTLVMGLSVAQAVSALGFAAQIKWPNDVVLSGKKVCGILTEMSLEGEAVAYVVTGVGINVNTQKFPPELSDKATSLYLESRREFDRCRVIGLVMKYFEENYEKFARTLDLSLLRASYERILANKDKPVRVLEKENSYEGLCLGINEHGELLVQQKDGSISCVGAGEVSVRGLYSYV